MTAHAEHPAQHGPVRAMPRAQRAMAVAVFALVILSAVAAFLLIGHRRQREARERRASESERARGLRISVARVETTPAHRTLTLPGDVRGYNQATLYAKISGYVRTIAVERGQRVKRGQLLAQIESPETARDVAAAEHTAQIARVNADRAEHLAPIGMVSAQDRDNAIASARIASQTLGRTQAVQAYTEIRAPFDGTITARYVDPGALVPAAIAGTEGALPIADLTDVDAIRVFVYVGQDAAPFVRTGDAATLWQDELPTRRISSTVTRIAGALDPRTRTMQVEVDLDNREWNMVPGTFAHVELQLAEPPMPILVDPSIVIRQGHTAVAVIEGGRVHFVPVDLGYNDGSRVRVLRGLAGGETVGLDIPAEVQDGDTVQPMPGPPPGG